MILQFLSLIQVLLVLNLGCRTVMCTSDNITTVEYRVAPDGQDHTDCFSYISSNVSCKTITYIIQNQCTEDMHLKINIEGQSNFTYNEPCLEGILSDNETITINTTYLCYVTLSGDYNAEHPEVTFERNDTTVQFYEICQNVTNSTAYEECLADTSMDNDTCLNTTMHEVCPNFTEPVCTSILSYFLTFSEPTIDKCSSTENHTTECGHVKLKIFDITLKGFNIQYRGGHRITAQNVHFEDFYVQANAELENPCHFTCEDSELSYTAEFNHLTVATDTSFMFKFENCSSATLKLLNTDVSSVKMYMSFWSWAEVTVDGVQLSGTTLQEKKRGSQIILRQVENETSESVTDLEPTSITFNNVTVTDNNIEVNETNYNAIVGIYLNNSMNHKSELTFMNCTCMKSSSLLDYVVKEGDLTHDRAEYLANHSVQLDNLIVTDNVGFSDIIRIVNLVAVSVRVDSCSFSKNSLKAQTSAGYEIEKESKKRIYRTAMLSIRLLRGSVMLSGSIFKNNIGSLGGAIYVATTQYEQSSLTVYNSTFTNNSVIDYNGQMSGLGGAIFIQSNVLDIFMENCIYSKNSAFESGGAIYIQSVYKAYKEPWTETTTPSPTATATLTPASSTQITKIAENSNITHLHNESCPENIDEWEIVCIRGPPGPPGDSGRAGSTGAPGYPGPSGPAGSPGERGEPGFTGATGPVGTANDTSRRKRSLIIGPVGPERALGYSDIPRSRQKRSLTFAQCPNDTDLYACKRCVQGPEGPPGYAGPTGATGFTGSQGFPGPLGESGPPGPRGETGAPGPSGDYIVLRRRRDVQPESLHVWNEDNLAFEPHVYRVKRSTDGTITSNDDCPVGEQGPLGPVGSTGSTGSAGAPGPSGPRGAPGSPGVIGATGAKGPSNLDNITAPETSSQDTEEETDDNEEPVDDEPPNDITFNIQNSMFQNNKANKYGGAVIFSRMYDSLNFNMDTVNFEDNVAGLAGGALSIVGEGKTSAAWLGCNFLHNMITNEENVFFDWRDLRGGSVLFSNQSIEFLMLKQGKIYNNLLNGFFTDGSTIDIKHPVINEFKLEDVVIYDNMANYSGSGVLDIDASHDLPLSVTVEMINCEIFNNTATYGAGVLYLRSSYQVKPGSVRIIVTGSTLSNNKCRSGYFCHAGVMYVFVRQNPYMENNLFLVDCTNSTFTNNVGHGVFSIEFEDINTEINLKNSIFTYNSNEYSGGVFDVSTYGWRTYSESPSFKMSISNVDFSHNFLKSDNNRKGPGGAIVLGLDRRGYKVTLTLLEARYFNNTSEGNGGALAVTMPASGSSVTVEDCVFDSNHAGRINQGGAIYLYYVIYTSDDDDEEIIPPNILVQNTSFTDNIAGQGGSIYQASSTGIEGTLSINNSNFVCCRDPRFRSYSQNGSLVFASLSTSLVDVTFQEFPGHENSICAVAGLVLDNTGDTHALENVQYNCDNARAFLLGETVSAEYNESDSNSSKIRPPLNPAEAPLDSLFLFCVQCTFLPYTSGNGSVLISNMSRDVGENTDEVCSRNNHEDDRCTIYGHYIETMSPCYPCPFGGDCTQGYVKARPNYWGYNHKGFTHFQTCPLGYCCNDIDIPCDTFYTCALHRRGRLCGECEPGYTESLMSRTCIPDEKCNDWWIWPAAVFLALSYLIWYMYKGDLLPGFEFLMIKVYSYRTATRTNVIHVKSREDVKDDPFYPSKPVALQSLKDSRIDKGYFDIIVYFVNIISLLKVKVEFQTSTVGEGFLYNIEKYFTRYLDVDMQQVANVTVCPFPGVNAVTKSLSRPIFVVMILGIWLTLYSISSLLMITFKKRKQIFSDKFNYFKLKLIEGYVETMKYSYSGLAGVTFIYLTCVGIGEHYYWKYNAEIQCFSNWQFGVIAFATIYTVPFSITTILGGKLLQKGRIGYVQFMVACFVPLPYLLYWFISFVILGKVFGQRSFSLKSLAKSTRNLMVGQVQDSKNKTEEKISEKAQVILDTYQGPYRDENSSWEGVIELRKLLFNTYYLINNNIYRLTLCTFTAVITLVHHNLVKPFKNENSNRTETLSLSLLCMACVTNSIKTVFTESGILVQSNTPTEQLLYLMNRLDRIMILFLLGYIIGSEFYYVIKDFSAKKKR